MRHVISILAVALVALAFISPVSPIAAQSATLQYGERAPGEITATEKRVDFEFEGQKNDVAIIQMLPTVTKGIIGAEVQILDSNNSVITNSADLLVIGRTGKLIAVELPEDGRYVISVYIRDTSKNVGAFEVFVDKATMLKVGETIEGTVTSAGRNERVRYTSLYVLDTTEDVTVVYQKKSGKYVPSVVVNSVERGGNLLSQQYLGGRSLTGGTLSVPGSRALRILIVGGLNFGLMGVDPVDSAVFLLGLVGN